MDVRFLRFLSLSFLGSSDVEPLPPVPTCGRAVPPVVSSMAALSKLACISLSFPLCDFRTPDGSSIDVLILVKSGAFEHVICWQPWTRLDVRYNILFAEGLIQPSEVASIHLSCLPSSCIFIICSCVPVRMMRMDLLGKKLRLKANSALIKWITYELWSH